jgi:hypothetical protein
MRRWRGGPEWVWFVISGNWALLSITVRLCAFAAGKKVNKRTWGAFGIPESGLAADRGPDFPGLCKIVLNKAHEI